VRRAVLRTATLVALLCVIANSIPAPTLATGPGFHAEQVLSGYKRPTFVAAHANPNLLYVLEQRGRIMVAQRADSNSPWVNAGVFLDMRSKVAGPFVGRGLLGMAFDPNYATNGKFYVFYTRKNADPVLNGDIVVAEYLRLTDLKARARSARIVVVVPHSTEYHFGGWLGFGPDGYLYMTTGDEAQYTRLNSQDKNIRLGKVLRLNPHAKRGKVAQVPPTNPFVGADGDDLVWAYGLRNPWRASFDRLTGDLWLPDVGQDLWEEVNRFSPASAGSGANLGWGMCEGSHAYPQPAEGPAPCTAAGTVAPLLEYPHADGNCSVIGGYVYRGSAQATLYGRYFYGDYCTGNVWTVPASYTTTDPIGDPFVLGKHINSFGEDASGEVYIVVLGGTIWHIVED